MANITGNSEEKIFTINRWLGLNENADGDTNLKIGESTIQENFKVTRDGHLQKRPGTSTVVDLFGLGAETRAPIKALWSGYVDKKEVLLGACDGKLYNFYNEFGEFDSAELGSVDTTEEVHIFGFSGNAYVITNSEYMVWDGNALSEVDGYVPVVYISTPPAGGGTIFENINRLNGKRRCWFSPDGTSTAFVLPEKGLSSVDYVKITATDEVVPSSSYTVNLSTGVVTFTSAPPAGTNSYEIAWTVPDNYRSQVIGMKYSELYNSSQDTRVFLYGDGTNRAIYSGMDFAGVPRADYFPDLYEIRVGDENTCITGMIRHYSKLICFKQNSTYSISYGEIYLDDGNKEAAFYSIPVNKIVGMDAMGQVQLVLNTPRTLFGSDLYEWRNGSSFGANLTIDERQAKRISDRISATLKTFYDKDCLCFDDNFSQEYWIYYNGTALVNNYVCDAWYKYTNLDIKCMASISGKLVFGTSDGKIKHMDSSYLSDDGDAIPCLWESGSMSFGKDYMRKFAAELWVGTTPAEKSEVIVDVRTDRTSEIEEKIITEGLATFSNVDFENFTFEFDVNPHIHKLKLKAKKFVYYKLIFRSNNSDSYATVVATDIKVRFTSYAK